MAKIKIPKRVKKRGKTITYNYSKAFTLLEVLVVITLLALVLSITLVVFWRISSTSAEVSKSSARMEREALLFWDFTRSIFGAGRVAVENGSSLYLITTGGRFFRGVVWCAYRFENGTLRYYEFPYPPDDWTAVPQNAVGVSLGRFKSVKFSARKGGAFFKSFKGEPEAVEVELNGERFLFAVGLR